MDELLYAVLVSFCQRALRGELSIEPFFFFSWPSEVSFSHILFGAGSEAEFTLVESTRACIWCVRWGRDLGGPLIWLEVNRTGRGSIFTSFPIFSGHCVLGFVARARASLCSPGSELEPPWSRKKKKKLFLTLDSCVLVSYASNVLIHPSELLLAHILLKKIFFGQVSAWVCWNWQIGPRILPRYLLRSARKNREHVLCIYMTWHRRHTKKRPILFKHSHAVREKLLSSQFNFQLFSFWKNKSDQNVLTHSSKPIQAPVIITRAICSR